MALCFYATCQCSTPRLFFSAFIVLHLTEDGQTDRLGKRLCTSDRGFIRHKGLPSRNGLGRASQALFLYVIKLLSHRKTGLHNKRGWVGREHNYYTPTPSSAESRIKRWPLDAAPPPSSCWKLRTRLLSALINLDFFFFPKIEIKVYFLRLDL